MSSALRPYNFRNYHYYYPKMNNIIIYIGYNIHYVILYNVFACNMLLYYYNFPSRRVQWNILYYCTDEFRLSVREKSAHTTPLRDSDGSEVNLKG